MLQPITYFGEASSASGIGALGINGQALIVQLITFVLVYVVLRRFAFKKILKVLAERRETIENGIVLGEKMQKEQDMLEANIKKAMMEARKEADEIVSQAHTSAREATKQAEEKAREKADSIFKEAHVRAEHDATRMRRDVEKEVVSLVAAATEAIIVEKFDEKKNEDFIKRALKEQKA